jgi:hypothetical protein
MTRGSHWKRISGFLLLMTIVLHPQGGAAADYRLILSGEWPTYGYASDQSRTKLNSEPLLPQNPTLVQTIELPTRRYSQSFASGVIGDDGTLYLPFFGTHTPVPNGGVQAVTAEGEAKWYFMTHEVEAQSPVVTKKINSLDPRDQETLIIFGTAGKQYSPWEQKFHNLLIAIYDKPECRCCVQKDQPFCDFTCLSPSFCLNKDPGFEWRHKAYVERIDGSTEKARCSYVNEQCAAWMISTDHLNPNQVPLPGPDLGWPYYEVSATSLISPDGSTVYYFVSYVGIFSARTHFVVAVRVNGADNASRVKWILTEGDPEGWIQAGCRTSGSQGWILSSAMLSDGSILFGTRAGCVVRVVDNGTSGSIAGLYQPPMGATVVGSVVGLTVEPFQNHNDSIYVATHGQNNWEPGGLYKTSVTNLIEGRRPDWENPMGKTIGPSDDSPGLLGSPLLATRNGVKHVYATVADWNDTGIKHWLKPDRGWLAGLRADNGQWDLPLLELKVGQTWYPAFNCTADGAGNIWMHGGLNQVAQPPYRGKILRTDLSLSFLAEIGSGTTNGFGYSEILTFKDPAHKNTLYAISGRADTNADIPPTIYKFNYPKQTINTPWYLLLLLSSF